MRTYNIYHMQKDLNNFPRISKCIHHLIVKEIDAKLSGIGLTPQQSMFIMAISKHMPEGLTQSELIKRFGISKSTCSGIIKRMEEAKYIKRKKGNIVLDENGQVFTEQLSKVEEEIDEKITKNFSKEEKEKLFELTNKVINNLKEDKQ